MNKLLKERRLPPLKTRDEMLDILQKEEYGYLPPKPDSISFRIQEEPLSDYLKNTCAGKAELNRVFADVSLNGKHFEIPFYSVIPKGKTNVPFFVCINFYGDLFNRYFPVEEIVDNGFAVMHLCYTEVTKDNDDFTDGLASVIYADGKRGPSSPGKIALWAWAAQRVLDYAYTLPELNHGSAAVCGHSRLGKTAFLAAATDERFRFAFSNDSGCSGAAISRGKGGETIKDIVNTFPYWFCPNYAQYIDREYDMPFDQHYLLSSIAPRYAYVASSHEDLWADPVSEYLNCLASHEAFTALGKDGFIGDSSIPSSPVCYHKGTIGYHYRMGTHYFSRYDWNKFIEFHKAKEAQK